MAVPFTSGKNSEKGEKSGGHTSRGVYRPPNNKTAATSNENTRVGTLKTRTTGK